MEIEYCSGCGSRWEDEDSSRGCWLCGGTGTTGDRAVAAAKSLWFSETSAGVTVMWKRARPRDLWEAFPGAEGAGVLYISHYGTVHRGMDMLSPALGVLRQPFGDLLGEVVRTSYTGDGREKQERS